MDGNYTDPTSWRDLITFLAGMGVILGVEQALPIPAPLRVQIGVLIVLLTYQFWNLYRGLILPGKKDKR